MVGGIRILVLGFRIESQFDPFGSIDEAQGNKRLGFLVCEFPWPWNPSNIVGSRATALVLAVEYRPAMPSVNYKLKDQT